MVKLEAPVTYQGGKTRLASMIVDGMSPARAAAYSSEADSAMSCCLRQCAPMTPASVFRIAPVSADAVPPTPMKLGTRLAMLTADIPIDRS